MIVSAAASALHMLTALVLADEDCTEEGTAGLLRAAAALPQLRRLVLRRCTLRCAQAGRSTMPACTHPWASADTGVFDDSLCAEGPMALMVRMHAARASAAEASHLTSLELVQCSVRAGGLQDSGVGCGPQRRAARELHCGAAGTAGTARGASMCYVHASHASSFGYGTAPNEATAPSVPPIGGGDLPCTHVSEGRGVGPRSCEHDSSARAAYNAYGADACVCRGCHWLRGLESFHVNHKAIPAPQRLGWRCAALMQCMSKLTELRLQAVPFGDGEAAAGITLALCQLKGLLRLHLEDCQIGSVAAFYILPAVATLPHIHDLSLARNPLRAAGAEIAATHLPRAPALRRLCVASCALGSRGGAVLADAVGRMRALRVLGLARNQVNEEVVGHLAVALRIAPQLRRVSVFEEFFSARARAVLLEAAPEGCEVAFQDRCGELEF